MRLLLLTLPTAAENVALDDALLQVCEAAAGDEDTDVLRVWEALTPAVVLGRSSRLEREVDVDACRAWQIPVVRRPSGGAAVVVGPGCLMYSIILSYSRWPQLRSIDFAHRFILGKIRQAVGPSQPPVVLAGTSDLAMDGDPPRKFSGNSLRCRPHSLLYHGTLLYDFPLPLLGTCLRSPPREPEYRGGRRHDEFVGNLPRTAAQLQQGLVEAWGASDPLLDWPRGLTTQLVADKYSAEAWTAIL